MEEQLLGVIAGNFRGFADCKKQNITVASVTRPHYRFAAPLLQPFTSVQIRASI